MGSYKIANTLMNPDQLCRLNWYFRGLLVMLVWLFNH